MRLVYVVLEGLDKGPFLGLTGFRGCRCKIQVVKVGGLQSAGLWDVRTKKTPRMQG